MVPKSKLSSENLNVGSGPSGFTSGTLAEVGAAGVVLTPFLVSNWAIFPSNLARRDSNSLFEQLNPITARLNIHVILVIFFILY
jgi:hypothetical protein